MIGLICAMIAFLATVLILCIFIVAFVVLVALLAVKMVHRADSRRIQNAKGNHIQR